MDLNRFVPPQWNDLPKGSRLVVFSRNAFVPCYGLAEATLFVSGKPAGEPPVLYRCDADNLRGNVAVQDEQFADNHLLAGSGSVAEGLQVEIVDPETSTPVPSDTFTSSTIC
jgi:acyl-CoA synthetase (AMP-forming)/AMP-acid ligase II